MFYVLAGASACPPAVLQTCHFSDAKLSPPEVSQNSQAMITYTGCLLLSLKQRIQLISAVQTLILRA